MDYHHLPYFFVLFELSFFTSTSKSYLNTLGKVFEEGLEGGFNPGPPVETTLKLSLNYLNNIYNIYCI